MLKRRICQVLKWIGLFLVLYILYAALTFILEPLFSHSATENPSATFSAQYTPNSEQVLCIDDNTDALVWRLRLIESAQKEIIFSTFQLNGDTSGVDMMAALKHAADRGVQVKMLIDGGLGFFPLQSSKEFHALATTENVEIKFYNPVSLLTPWTGNYRLHDKYIAADDQAYILGGRNTMDLFLGNYQEVQNTDRDMLVYSATQNPGNSIKQVQHYFRHVWQDPTNRHVPYKRTAAVEKAAQNLDDRYQALHSLYPEAFTETDWSAETLPVKEVRFLSNPISAHYKEPQLWRTLHKVMQTGQNITIQTPYIICSDEMYAGLTDLTESGKHVEIITNAVENGANPWGCTDYLNEKENILATGSEVYEYAREHSLHTKTILVDDTISLVGSFNMDMRSAYLDTEIMLYIDSPEINAMLRQGITNDMEYSDHVMPDGSSTPGAHFERPAFSTGKNIVYQILRVIIRPIRHLL